MKFIFLMQKNSAQPHDAAHGTIVAALFHPQPPLAALVTYCHFAAIYGRSPVGLPVPATLKRLPDAGAMNSLLQELAWQAVISYPQAACEPSRQLRRRGRQASDDSAGEH